MGLTGFEIYVHGGERELTREVVNVRELIAGQQDDLRAVLRQMASHIEAWTGS